MKRTTFVIFIAFVAALLYLSGGCKGGEEKAVQPEPVNNVRVWKAAKEDAAFVVSAVGTLEPEEEVIVGSEVSARLTRIFHDEGDMVGEGEALALLDTERFRFEVEKAEAELKRAQSALLFFEEDFKRKEGLFKEGIVSKEAYEESLSGRDEARAGVQSEKAVVEIARKDLENSRVKAPFPGLVSERYVSQGSLVGEGDKLFRLMDVDPVKVSARIPERYLDSVKKGREVTLTVSAFSGEFKGKIYFVSPHIDEGTRSFEIKARIANPKGLLKPGLFAEVNVTTGMERGVFLVPESGVVRRKEGFVLFVVKGDGAEERKVEVGERMAGRVVVTSGLVEGESVVIDGAHNIRGGSKVKVVD